MIDAEDRGKFKWIPKYVRISSRQTVSGADRLIPLPVDVDISDLPDRSSASRCRDRQKRGSGEGQEKQNRNFQRRQVRHNNIRANPSSGLAVAGRRGVHVCTPVDGQARLHNSQRPWRIAGNPVDGKLNAEAGECCVTRSSPGKQLGQRSITSLVMPATNGWYNFRAASSSAPGCS